MRKHSGLNKTEVRKAKVLDATHLELSKPIEVAPGETALISLAVSQDQDAERVEWFKASLGSLNAAYGDDEPEYSLLMLREHNPEYKA